MNVVEVFDFDGAENVVDAEAVEPLGWEGCRERGEEHAGLGEGGEDVWGNGFVGVPLEGGVEEVGGYEVADCFLPF